MDLFREWYAVWRDLFDNRSDPRVKNWFLMDTPTNTVLLIAVYIYFVKVQQITPFIY